MQLTAAELPQDMSKSELLHRFSKAYTVTSHSNLYLAGG